MAQQEVSCGLEYVVAPDLQGSLTEAFHANYSFIVTPVVHPRFRRHHIADGNRVGGFTRSDMILSPQDWTSRIVGRLSPYLNVDSPNDVVRQRHEDCMNEELSYSKGLGLPALLVTVHGENSHNLARNLLSYLENSHHPTLIWAQVPMMCSRTLRNTVVRGLDDDEEAWNEPWLWWSKFHERLQWDKRAGVVLELSADLPSEEIMKRWLGEPVKAVILPTNIFHNNRKGYPVLSRAHQQVLISLVEREAQVVVCGSGARGERGARAEHYRQYVARLWARRPAPNQDPMMDYARGWEDYLQTPLQPLADNLDTHTYNVFEKDPIKYDQYQKAITQALQHLLKRRENSSCEQNETKDLSDVINRLRLGSGDNKQCAEEKDGPFVVMVLGAGRGPLVRAALNASDIVKTKIKVIAVEKNPCAVVVLEAQARELWSSRDVTVVPGDMRRLTLANKADIIVSELLGSWGDNELSPECLDGAAGLLKPDGISIPHRYTSYVAPISSPRLWAAAKAAVILAPHKNNLEMLWVVYMQNKHDIGETKPVFTFEHPAAPARDHEGRAVTDHRDNRRQCTLTWTAQQDNVMHGFGGYFDCQLFGEEEISIVPATHSNGMISWFPVFIPIKSPLRVSKGSVITARFWRCVDSHRVWYEWLVELDGRSTELHNCGGKSAEMLL
ncbi:protein arginine N-methyltransferase 5 [Cydia strobilella]|uniref:protein arginine N-methyltransferase 5 n=1 Tax=Cydia strobilella TaxID=1100964 RepID=UPI0030055C59